MISAKTKKYAHEISVTNSLNNLVDVSVIKIYVFWFQLVDLNPKSSIPDTIHYNPICARYQVV